MARESADQGVARLNEVFDRRVLQVLQPLTLGLAIVFALALVVNLNEGLPGSAIGPLVALKAILVVTLLGIHFAFRRGWNPGRLANQLAVAIAVLTLANVLLALALVGDSFYLVYMVLILMSLGSVVLSIPWLVVAVGGAMVAWIAVSWSFLTGDELLHFGLALFAASALSVVICLARRRSIADTERALDVARKEAAHRRQAEEAAAMSKERLSLAISASKGGWWFQAFDSEQPDGIPDEIELDPVIKGFIGFEDHEMPNSRAAWSERVLPKDREEAKVVSRAHLRGEVDLHEIRYRIRHKDGGIRWIYSCGRIERDSEGRPVGASGIAWDVTEQVDSENRLRKLSRAVEHSSSLILITDTEGKIEYVNPKFTRVTGYTLEEATGETPAILKSEKNPPGVYKELWETILAGNEWQGEFQNLKKNGEPHWVIASISPIRDSNGTITHFVGVEEDITERRKVESQLVQAQKMEGIGQLVGGVAHDFNNLLTGIVGFSDLSLATMAEDDPLRVNLQQISKAGESAMSLTQQLLTFSRQQTRPPRIVDLNEVISGFKRLLRRTISEDIDLVTNLASRPAPVNADSSQIEQILVNLAVNARDAMPAGGRLTVAVAESQLEESALSEELNLAPGRYVNLVVSDTGRGMDEATCQRIFEPFFTTKPRGRGTGLGLSTVYGIVKQSAGHIQVDSVLGKGTTFRIQLPWAEDSTKEADVAGERETIATGNERVLLVEDDELVRDFTAKLLKQNGYRVQQAESALEALETCEGQSIDLLVSDVVMPRMNGVELADQLGRERPEMKVLFLSGYADHEIIEKRVLEGDATFLAKPFAVNEFVRTVRELLDQ